MLQYLHELIKNMNFIKDSDKLKTELSKLKSAVDNFKVTANIIYQELIKKPS